MTSRVSCLLGVVALIAPAVALAHTDDPKATSVLPPYEGVGWRESDGGVAGTSFASSGVTLRSWITPAEFGMSFGNDCWGYTSPSGREYAIMGLSDGTAFVEITDPGAPVIVGTIPGPNSTWRDMKTYQGYCYAVSEAGNGIQVIDMTSIDAGVVTLVTEITGQGTDASHNVALNEASGHLYRCGGGSNGLRMYSLANPANPVFVGDWPDRYVHDAVIVSYTSGPWAGQEIAFCCGGLNGGFNDTGLDIVDVTDKQNPQVLSHLGYANSVYSHQAWLSEDRQYLYLNDEINEQDLGLDSTTHVIDVSNLNAPFEVIAYSNSNPASTHNLYVKGDKVYASNYRSGLRVYDVSNPTSPSEIGFFDTAPGGDGTGYNGLWSNYPFFASSTIIGSDRERGLFVWSEGTASIGFAYPSGRPEFLDPAGAVIDLAIGSNPGDVVDEGSGLLHFDDGSGEQTVPLVQVGAGGGDFEASLPPFTCPATVTWYVTILDDSGSTWRDPFSGAYQATAALGTTALFEDDFETDLGWTVVNDPDLSDGQWERGVPVGGGDRGDPAADADGSGACYLTDNVDGNSDVDGGVTTLVSPVLDATGDGDAYLAYDRWYSNNVGGSPNEDSMPIEISNDGGSSWTLLEDVTENAGAWVRKVWRIDDVLTPTASMQVRFAASDLFNGSVVEAGVDGVQIVFFDCEAATCAGDANGDGLIDVNDLNAVILDWGTDGSANGADFTGQTPGSPPDGFVDVNDLNTVIVSWGSCP